MSVEITVDNLKELMEALNTLADANVLVGIPSDSADNKRTDTPITNAQIGFINEFGAPEMNIPDRPFLIPGMNEAWPEASKRLTDTAQVILSNLSGTRRKVDDALNSVGILAVGKIVQKINDGLSPPLAAATIAARARKMKYTYKGIDPKDDRFSGCKPLLDTGALKQSITYLVKKDG